MNCCNQTETKANFDLCQNGVEKTGHGLFLAAEVSIVPLNPNNPESM